MRKYFFIHKTKLAAALFCGLGLAITQTAAAFVLQLIIDAGTGRDNAKLKTGILAAVESLSENGFFIIFFAE